jgi:hypothetical protein
MRVPVCVSSLNTHTLTLTKIVPSDLVCGSAFTKDILNRVRCYRISLGFCGIRHDRNFRSCLTWVEDDDEQNMEHFTILRRGEELEKEDVEQRDKSFGFDID